MIRTFVIVTAFGLSSCAHNVPQSEQCPVLPSMATTETLKDYTLHIIDLYDECSKLKNN